MLKTYIPYVNYYVNYTYISENLCENKDKPMMECNGKCHLEKTIKKAEEEESKGKTTPTIIKVQLFQEIPSQSLRFKLNNIIALQNENKKIAPNYSSPELEIISPPPRFI
jgi:hypothetical protein